MSDTVLTKGIIAELKTPLTQEYCNEFNEQLYKLRSNLSINYEGTLLIQSETNSDIYQGIVWGSSKFYRGNMIYEISQLPSPLREILNIKEETSKTFYVVWYNGGDADHDMLTLEEFRKV